MIGPSITIRGEVSGDEDLLIEGKVDGSVDLELHAVTVGGEGRVKANITARVVTVEGEVEGDLKARDQVILRTAARVKGDITAPRVVLEDGANFRGLVDMGEPQTERASAASSPSTSATSSKASGGKASSSGGSISAASAKAPVGVGATGAGEQGKSMTPR
jgi:cytoskeletal protein CcmA (bactofilin family)